MKKFPRKNESEKKKKLKKKISKQSEKFQKEL